MKNLTALFVCIFASPFILFAQLPSGSIAKYQLDNSAIDIGGNSYNGTLTSTTATTNRLSLANSATAFTAGTSTGSLPVGLITAMSNDFTLGYWFKTNMTANSSSQWYGGNAMVDAEVCGGTSDWGTALIDGGKMCFGIGNPDLTIKSTLTYNDNTWHFVTATRNKAAGTIILYVDGVQVATTSGTSTVALTAPSFLGLGKNPCASSAMYTGSLDDIIAYNRVLSGSEVTNLYSYSVGTVLAVKWLSWTGAVNGNHIDLQWQTDKSTDNDHFEIEHSTNGTAFSVIGTVADGNGAYAFTDNSPAKGNNFYRIRQVDKDGKYSWSSVIKIIYSNNSFGITLQTNPVADELVLVNSNQLQVQRIQVTDISGRVVLDQMLHNSNALIKMPVQNLRPGFYIARVSIAGSSTTISLVKQ